MDISHAPGEVTTESPYIREEHVMFRDQLRRFIDEQAVPLVVIQSQHLIRKIRNYQAGRAGAVVIGRINSHSGPRNPVFVIGDSRSHALFRKCAVRVVDIQFVRLGVIAD